MLIQELKPAFKVNVSSENNYQIMLAALFFRKKDENYAGNDKLCQKLC